MRGPGHTVELVQVIGHHPQIDQPAEKLGQHLDIIVDPPQQHGLIQHGHAGIHQPAKGGGHVGIDLGRMVAVHDHESRQPRAPQPGQKFIVHPLGNHDRQPRVDAEPAKVGDFGKLPGDFRQAAIVRSSAGRHR